MIDIDRPPDALWSNIKYPVLILAGLSGNFETSFLDKILDSLIGGFLIIGHPEKIDDFAGEMKLVVKSHEIPGPVFNHDFGMLFSFKILDFIQLVAAESVWLN
jgi:hypothetical protein